MSNGIITQILRHANKIMVPWCLSMQAPLCVGQNMSHLYEYKAQNKGEFGWPTCPLLIFIFNIYSSVGSWQCILHEIQKLQSYKHVGGSGSAFIGIISLGLRLTRQQSLITKNLDVECECGICWQKLPVNLNQVFSYASTWNYQTT